MSTDSSSAPKAPLRLRRRLFHLLASLTLPALALLLPQAAVVALAGAVAVLAVASEAARLTWAPLNRWFLRRFQGLLKPAEMRRPTAATYLAVASVVTLAVFQRPVAALALFYVAVGDPAAGIVGTRYGHIRLPWPPGSSRAKSLEGTLAFSAAAVGVALLLWSVGVYSVLWPAVAGALAAALVELLPIPIEDNVSVPLASAAVMGVLWSA